MEGFYRKMINLCSYSESEWIFSVQTDQPFELQDIDEIEKFKFENINDFNFLFVL